MREKWQRELAGHRREREEHMSLGVSRGASSSMRGIHILRGQYSERSATERALQKKNRVLVKRRKKERERETARELEQTEETDELMLGTAGGATSCSTENESECLMI